MKTFPYFHKLFATPLVLLPTIRAGMEFDLLSLIGVDSPPRLAAAAAAERPRMDWRVAQIYGSYGSVGVVNISGVIDKHISDADMECYGGCDLGDVDKAISIAANDDRIERVVFNINSPGGSVTGVAETALRMAALRGTRETHAYVDGMACSGAQWLAAQCDIMAMAPSARAGSIGVYLAVLDATRALELEGLKVELIKAGKWKAMGAPFNPLTAEERDRLQVQVNEIHAEFRAAVRSGRGRDIADEAMEGQVLSAKEAINAGLADVLTTANLDEYVAALV